ncbi:MAG: hypothetical protein EXX96DRAFT_615069 [Benjaminiella poitrasii]|nr:MAG: hypothetical protein EXX96DRAFT_615069 [Benjaminiella poitrasii]
MNSKFTNNRNIFNINSDIGSIQFGDRHGAEESSSNSMSVKRKFDDDLKWNKFLKNQEFYPCSFEYNRVIRSEKTVSSRPSLNKELYDRLVYKHIDVDYALPDVCMPYIANAINQGGLKSYRKAIRMVPESE